MSNWSARRRVSYISTILLVIILVMVGIYFIYFKKQATCFDGIKNLDEKAIDCGGGCQAVCDFEVVDPVVKWSRPFRLTKGEYTVAAYIDNPNPFGVKEIKYRFRLQDKEGKFVTDRVGSTFMNSEEQFVVFESNLPTGERIPATVSFEITSQTDWYKQTSEEYSIPLPSFSFRNKRLSVDQGDPKARAVITNTSDIDSINVEVYAVIFDIDDNAIAASKTLIEELPAKGSQSLTFTWPEAFEKVPSRFEVYPRINRVAPK